MIGVNVFSWRLYTRVVILVGICVVYGMIFLNSEWIFSQVILSSLIILLALDINRLIHKTNREVSRLLEAIHYEEFSTSFQVKGNSKYSSFIRQLEEVKNRVDARMKGYKSTIGLYEKVINEQEHAVVLFNTKDEVLIQTSNALSILNMPNVKSVRQLEVYLPGLVNQVDSLNDSGYLTLSNQDMGYKLDEDLEGRVTKFKVGTVPHTLILFSRINTQRSGEDIETWINFGKVISHEILNGISPLISLSETIQSQLDKLEGNEDRRKSMQKALDIIIERSKSLQLFSERYRTLNKLPEPQKTLLKWNQVFSRCLELHKDVLVDKQIQVNLSGTELESSFFGDAVQIDQVFTNLLLNSIQALSSGEDVNRLITVEINADAFNFLISFNDNGIGIDKQNFSKIFVPFYSTKKDGSGIGLSVIKQVLWKHKAEIFLSEKKEETSFVIRFPKAI